MANNNTIAYRVHGPAVITVGTATNNAIEDLGVAENGCNIQITQHLRPIYSDVGGPETPVDVQDMGQTGKISVDLTAWNEEVLQKLYLRAGGANGQAATFGDVTPRGRFIGTDGKLFCLTLIPQLQTANTYWEDGWHFYYCHLDAPPAAIRVGTVITAHRLLFSAIPHIRGSTIRINAVSGATYGKVFTRFNFANVPTAGPSTGI